MNQREKEEYLREYAQLKAEGKPFFPYAVAKDALTEDHQDAHHRPARDDRNPDALHHPSHPAALL